MDSGNYQCYAQNGIGGAFSPFLNVTVSSMDYFILEPPNLIASSGLKVSWQWFFEGNEISINDTHFISKNGELVVLRAADRFGSYQLKADSESGSAFSEKYFVKEDETAFATPPEFTIVLRPQDVIVNAVDFTSAIFECVPSLFGRYPAEIKWFLNGEPLVIDGREVRTEHGNRRLIINNVVSLIGSSVHSAKLRCEAEAGDESVVQEAEAHLEIIEPPIINKDVLPSEAMHKVGDSVNLVCKTTKAWPRAKISWFFNKEKLTTTNSEVLKIDHLETKHFGVYQCKASNDAGADFFQVWIKADDGNIDLAEHNSLKIIEKPKDTTVLAGKDVFLQCRTEDPHNTQLNWKMNGTDLVIDNMHLSMNATTLTIHAARKDDSGVYTCFATNNGLTAESSALLTVSGTKLIEYGPSDQSILIGSNVHIPCKLSDEFSGRNDLWTVWTRNGIEIAATGDAMRRIKFNNGNLIINQVGPDNIGLYKCTVHSVNGEEENASGWLKIIEKPSMPHNVHAILVNDTVPAKIRVSWRPGFDGNSPIIKHSIEMRTMGPTGLWSDWENVVDNVIENVPNEMCCSALVDNIRPSSTAEFRVISFNRFGAGKPSRPSEDITMPQQPPAAAPRNVAASARSSSSVMVQWQPPPPEQWNGNILGYHIRYRLYGYASADWNEKNVSNTHARNALIEPLITWREYEIQVAAYNDRGLGVYSKPIEVTTLEGVPMQAPQNVHVSVLNSTHIKVSFDPPDQQMISGVNLGYKIEIWKGAAHVGKPFKTVRIYPELTRIEEVIGNLDKFGHYNLTTVCFTAPGDGPSSKPIEVVTDEDIPGPVAAVDFDQIMSNSVVIQWEKPVQPNGVILKYIIRYWKDGAFDKNETEVDAEESELTIDGLTPSTKYSVDIQAVTKVGVGPKVEAKFESGVPPELPTKPTSLAVSDVGARSVVLQFVPGFDGHSFIKRWHVEACIGSSSIFTQIFNISAPKARSFVVEGLRPFTKYKLRLIAENVRGRGGPSDPTRTFQTRQTDPENPPEKVFAEPISDNQISLVWTPLMPSHWNGDPSGYLIHYRAVGDKSKLLTEIEKETDEEWKEVRASNPKASDLTLTGLRPFTSYQIKIYAENTFGKSTPSEVVFATTYESVPSGAPENVTAELDDFKRSVLVKWEDVDDKHKNGIITGYIVRVVPDETRLRQTHSIQAEVFGANQHSTKINGLRSFTDYRIFVVALTIVGEGPENSNPPLIKTSEGIPEEPVGLAFSYISSTEVRLKWLPPINANGRLTAYEVRHWKFGQEKNPTVVRLPYSMFSFSASQLTPNSTYVFGVKAETKVGWGPEEIVSVFTSDHSIPPPIPPTPQKHSTKLPTATDMWIQWPMRKYDERELTANDAVVRMVTIQYQKSNEDEWISYPNSISAKKNEVHLTNLVPNTAYRAKIKFIGDSADSIWSVESDWIKTKESFPSKPPSQLQASPYESSSILLQFSPLERSFWNSDAVGYKIFYRVYPSNDSFKMEEINPSEELPESGKIQHVVSKLSSFHHYVVQVQSFNTFGNSVLSRPVFVYVGYSIPKQTIRNLRAEPLSSTSIRVIWDEWKPTDDDVISGYKVRYAPLLSTLSSEIENEANGGDSTEEVVISEKNEIILTDLRKFTEYQISVSGYNRAGEGQSTVIRNTTLEDLPGPVGQLKFQDILFDSVNVSWTPPQQPNGKIFNYIIKYRTYKLEKNFEDRQQSTPLNYFLATKLDENATYFFTVQAENGAGTGAEVVGNVTIGYNIGAPDSPTKPTFVSEPSSFILYWKDGVPGTTQIIGHLVQAKRVSTVKRNTSPTVVYETDRLKKRAKRDDEFDYQPQHVIGEWVTISNVLGTDTEYRISYRQLEPASIYVFRVFARNQLGIGLPSPESAQLIVPESIPDDPFYTQWWFIIAIGLAIMLVIIIFITMLCWTGSRNRYKHKKRESFDSLQLADGGIVSYELRQSKNKQVRRTNELPSRPDTHTSWISNDQLRDPLNGAVGYGSIASDVDMVGSRANSVYRALATDNLPLSATQGNRQSNYMPYSQSSRVMAFSSRNNVSDNGQKSPVYRLSDYNTAHLTNDDNLSVEHNAPYSHERQQSNDDGNTSSDNLARHYQVSNDNEDIYRATWRKTKEQMEQMRSPGFPLPPLPPTVNRPVRSSEVSQDTSISDGSSSQTNGIAAGISLRALFPQSGVDRSSSGSHTPNIGATPEMMRDQCFCKQNGCIHLILGPMFSGKTTEMFRLCTRQKLAGKQVKIVKYALDNRYDDNMASTHDRSKMEAVAAKEIKDVFPQLLEADVIGIDEGQFFTDIVEFAEKLANNGKIVFIAALDGNYRREPFPCIADLLALAENAFKLTAVCKPCGQPAPFTLRTIETTEVEVIGGEEIYMAVCRDCYRKFNKTRDNGTLKEIFEDHKMGIENCEPIVKRPKLEELGTINV
uniref:Thymidine kinase, cytosolic n=1 Tax=Panagrolaimus sp. JU765 TaxID=591449 RepID=A0AC34QH49_9BILA